MSLYKLLREPTILILEIVSSTWWEMSDSEIFHKLSRINIADKFQAPVGRMGQRRGSWPDVFGQALFLIVRIIVMFVVGI